MVNPNLYCVDALTDIAVRHRQSGKFICINLLKIIIFVVSSGIVSLTKKKP